MHDMKCNILSYAKDILKCHCWEEFSMPDIFTTNFDPRGSVWSQWQEAFLCRTPGRDSNRPPIPDRDKALKEAIIAACNVSLNSDTILVAPIFPSFFHSFLNDFSEARHKIVHTLTFSWNKTINLWACPWPPNLKEPTFAVSRQLYIEGILDLELA